ncbi:MAG TPA: transcription-repair coupling factor [Anaerolineaceae bacterium]|nr:transcription-repair coupling factor [Anaerolineaceae bacterium]
MIPIRFSELEGYNSILTALKQGVDPGPLGLVRPIRLPLALAIQREQQVPVLFITGQVSRAQVLLEEMRLWDERAHGMFFPEPVPIFYEASDWEETTRAGRIAALNALSCYWIPGQKPTADHIFIIASIKSVMARTLPRRDFILARKLLKIGESLDLEWLVQQLVRLGYEFHEIVTGVGQFSRRGGIVDIWLVDQEHPIRIEFFGDEIESIRTFDEISQRSIQSLMQCTLVPAREFILPEDWKAEQNIYPCERDIGLLHPNATSILSYLPKGTLVFLDDRDILITVSEEVEKDSLELRQQLIEGKKLPRSFPSPYYSWSELYDQMLPFTPLNMSFSGMETKQMFRHAIQPAPRFGGKLDDLMDTIADEMEAGHSLSIVSRQTERLQKLWQERFAAQTTDSSNIEFINRNLSSGWKITYPDRSTHTTISDEEIFGWQPAIRKRRRRSQQELIVFDFGSFKPGDYVVHFEYGIALFQGLVKRTLDGVEKEYLFLQYADGDELYVPVYQADRVSLYIGPDARPPKLSSLGSQTWQGMKVRVKQAVQYVAKDLLELYSHRQSVEGYPFAMDSDWQRELEASFPYDETEDQLQAIEDVKRDMEKDRPMDRLLCGDVGYGKTEVAVRAAFKAAMDGKQVAMLVPTTVLTQQHYETFKQRLAPFPVNVEMLSRFRTDAEQQDILLSLAAGEIDIIIGTHRLLQKDVKFKDLGLLIIDEEQRFGVMHKEFFKKMRTRIDVLTLTATPIPRTLYMALSGIRDISMINTAPTDRLPVTTHVGGYDSEIVRRAILRELDRGGQVFFVHNRVQTINSFAEHLRSIVPEARIAVAHGQMPEQKLANVMHEFTQQKVDVLLSTSIIESGLDIPNANTLIVDRGDTFGLAQLYQLRGRVGRGTQRAYAYFFFNTKRKPTIDGLERLEVIAENSQLGSGYSIAMRDLEMRGAGDLLGTQQHGHIAAVGFYLYTRLLSDAVRSLKGDDEAITKQLSMSVDQSELRPFVSVELPLPISIPASYITDGSVRLEMYRKLARINSETGFEDIRAEFQDRFGTPPQEVLNLVWQTEIKLKAEQAGLYSISVESKQLILRYPALAEDVKHRALRSLEPDWRSGKNEYYPRFTIEDGNWKEKLLLALEKLSGKT